MTRYIILAFRVCFPRAGKIAAAFHSDQEMWVVAIDCGPQGLHVYTMTVGSDDDEFSFSCLTDEARARVAFPLPPE